MDAGPSTSRGFGEPYVQILIQPAQKALRFRYECEGRSAGSTPGANSTPENRTFPTIQILNHSGPAVVVVSCVTKDQPYRPHPHKLVGKDGCKQGLCTMAINNKDMICSFSNLGIQCVKRKDIEEALQERENIKVDPFRTGFKHKHQAGSIDLNSVRLCFQVFIEGSRRSKFENPLTPIVSDPIYDKKAMCDLVICKLSACSATVLGGTEIILLCEKIVKEDIQVCFSEVQGDTILWEGFGDFQPSDVHKQVAITFKTPKYHDTKVKGPVDAVIQLKRPSDGSVSEPRAFQFLPVDADPDRILEKKRKLPPASFRQYIPENPGVLRGAEARPLRYPYSPRMKLEQMEMPCVNPQPPNPFRLNTSLGGNGGTYSVMQPPPPQPSFPGLYVGPVPQRMDTPFMYIGDTGNVDQMVQSHQVYSVPSSLETADQDQGNPSGISSISQSLDLNLSLASVDLENMMMDIPYNILASHLSDVSGHMSNEGFVPDRVDYFTLDDQHVGLNQGHDPSADSLNRLHNQIMELNNAARGGGAESMQ